MLQIKRNSFYYPFNPEFPIRVFEEAQSGTAFHGHDFTEVVFVVRGRGRHLVPGMEYFVEQGDVFVIPQGGVHGYDQTADLILINLLFDGSRLPLALMELYSNRVYKLLFARRWDPEYHSGRYPGIHPPEARFEELLAILRPMIESTIQNSRSRCYNLGMLMALLSCLCEWWENVPEAEMQNGLDLPRIIAYCNKHFSDKVYLDDLARLSSMSRSTLLRHFSAAMGMTPMKYLCNLRLCYAAELLLNTCLSPSEVAERSGFRDMSYFFRAFQKKYALPPLQYRQGIRKTKPGGRA